MRLSPLSVPSAKRYAQLMQSLSEVAVDLVQKHAAVGQFYGYGQPLAWTEWFGTATNVDSPQLRNLALHTATSSALVSKNRKGKYNLRPAVEGLMTESTDPGVTQQLAIAKATMTSDQP